jgi:hypothetical protein
MDSVLIIAKTQNDTIVIGEITKMLAERGFHNSSTKVNRIIEFFVRIANSN